MAKKRRKAYCRLDRRERKAIEHGLDRGDSCRSMAGGLGRSASTIHDEVERVCAMANGELEAYAKKFIQPYLASKIKPRLYTALEGLSFSDLNTATKNAFYTAALAGSEDGFNTCQLARETYVLKHHSIEDEEGFIRYLIQCGCTLREIASGSGISMRRIQAVSSALKKEA